MLRRLLGLGLVCAAVAGDDATPAARRPRPNWQGRLEVHSIASIARKRGRSGWNEVTQGNKIVLPPSVLELLMSRQSAYTQFQILNPAKRGKRLFTGPLDFSAEEGECYLPSWVMKQLSLCEGDQCAVATACFPSAVFAKFQPHTSDFLDVVRHHLLAARQTSAAALQPQRARVLPLIMCSGPSEILRPIPRVRPIPPRVQADHYSLLMRTLENFAALTAGSTVRVTDGRRVYSLDVIEVKGKENVSHETGSETGSEPTHLKSHELEPHPPFATQRCTR